jgi:hypothetical protein
MMISGDIQAPALYCIRKAYENLNICLSRYISIMFLTSNTTFTECAKEVMDRTDSFMPCLLILCCKDF